MTELNITIVLLAVTAALVATGAFLHHRGRLVGRRAWAGWIALCCVPLVLSIAHAALG